MPLRQVGWSQSCGLAQLQSETSDVVHVEPIHAESLERVGTRGVDCRSSGGDVKFAVDHRLEALHGEGEGAREGRRGEELIFMHLRVDPGTSRALIHQPCHLSRRLFWKCCFAGSVEGALGRIGRTCGTASKSTRRLPLPCGTSPGSAAASGSTWWSASRTPPGLGRWPVSCCRRSKQKRTGGRHEMGRNQLAGIVFEL